MPTGPRSLPLIPKKLWKNQRDTYSLMFFHTYQSKFQRILFALTEDIDIDLDDIAELSTEPKKNTQSLQIDFIERKYPVSIQWKYVSKMSVEPCSADICHYLSFCHYKDHPEHTILLKNLRYQPHNFILDQEICLFMNPTLSVL